MACRRSTVRSRLGPPFKPASPTRNRPEHFWVLRPVSLFLGGLWTLFGHQIPMVSIGLGRPLGTLWAPCRLYMHGVFAVPATLGVGHGAFLAEHAGRRRGEHSRIGSHGKRQ